MLPEHSGCLKPFIAGNSRALRNQLRRLLLLSHVGWLTFSGDSQPTEVCTQRRLDGKRNQQRMIVVNIHQKSFTRILFMITVLVQLNLLNIYGYNYYIIRRPPIVLTSTFYCCLEHHHVGEKLISQMRGLLWDTDLTSPTLKVTKIQQDYQWKRHRYKVLWHTRTWRTGASTAFRSSGACHWLR